MRKRDQVTCIGSFSYDECPDNSIGARQTMKQCAMLPGCKTQPRMRDVRRGRSSRTCAQCGEAVNRELEILSSDFFPYIFNSLEKLYLDEY